MVELDNKGNKYINDKPINIIDLQKRKEYKNKVGRLHVIYETEYANEHRQKTSNDLSEKLIDMGLLNDDTMIDMFAHSYGGRRSLQFAMDYPEHVRSLTTIGTPYDKNMLGTVANTFPGIANELANKNATEYSDYLDFNTDNQRNDDGVLHSNVYTDMKSEAMEEDINNLKIANPEAYQRINEMEITAAAGRDYSVEYSGGLGISENKKYDTHDGAVSIKSQHAESLGKLVDYRPSYEVTGNGISNPAHSHEIESEDFIDLISEVNSFQKD